MTTLSGLLYVTHNNVGTRSEGPSYYLQTMHGNFELQYAERHSWEIDYYLEYFGRHIVEVEGTLLGSGVVQVKNIRMLCLTQIPQEDAPTGAVTS